MNVPQPPPRDEALLDVLRRRDGEPTRVEISDGTVLIAHNIAWGYDMGDEYSHITTNASPFVDGQAVDLFFTNDVHRLVDPDSGDVLFEWR